jgi:alkanesulfonate monooxygenase SsuD/methylene tetrahydromethanopterin reductase-like flavin-dependent oxidoreductase (luciferase family)
MPSQLPVLAAIAARTDRIRLGTGVLLAPLFDPLHLAEDAATVDLLAAGRLILGLGNGWREEEFEGFGIPRRERASRLEAAVTVLRQAWGDGLATGDGRHFRYPAPGLNVTPKPIRGAATPIWLGAGVEPAVRRAGRIADGYLGSGASPQALAERAAWIRDEAEAAGRDPTTIELAVHRVTFAWRGADAWERAGDAARYMSWKYADMTPARASRDRRGPGPDDRPTLDDVRSRSIVGSPEAVADQIRAYAGTLGPTGSFVFRAHLPGLDPTVQREAFDTLAEEVLPLLRD